MAILDVIRYPNAILREVCEPVTSIEEHKQLIEDLKDTLQKSIGLGIAANQVGVSVRIIVVRPISNPKEMTVLVNPEIIESEGESYLPESCLSIPGYTTKVHRFSEVTIKALNENGESIEFQEEGYPAVVLQHEIDHLDGKVYIDRLGSVQKDMFRTKWHKLQREFKRLQKEK